MMVMYAGALVLLVGFLWLVWVRRFAFARFGLVPPFLRLRGPKYQPISVYSRPGTPNTEARDGREAAGRERERDASDNASLHSLHTVRAVQRARSTHHSSSPRYSPRHSIIDYQSSDGDDTDALLGPSVSPNRKSHPLPKGLPPSYSSTWSNWTALFAPRPEHQHPPPSSSTLFVPADYKDAPSPALSRTGSSTSVRSATPLLPPGYEVNRLLSELEDPDA
jgi:hypothetical protein